MPFYSPLRYPGGKRRLLSVVSRFLERNDWRDIQYAEPFAGGAAIALALLMEEYASVIHINDLSRPVYAFWYAALNETTELCQRFEGLEASMDEWERQRAVYDRRETADLLDLGLATLFLNRTNRSGIVAGGVIGGKLQTGQWTIGARFNKGELIQRIRKIGRYSDRIQLYQLDALEFTEQVVAELPTNAFTFYDPPYIESGGDLYLNDYHIADHQQLAERITQLEQPWVVTYDYAAIQHGLYPFHRRVVYDLKYTAQARYSGQEAMFLSNRLELPDEWLNSVRFPMRHLRSKYQVYGRIFEP